MMATLDELFATARSRLQAGQLLLSDLDQLQLACAAPTRQRLLYLQSTSPFIGAELCAAAIHEPAFGGAAQLNPTADDLPYNCVHDAIIDGWEIIHFPNQRMLMQEAGAHEEGVLGYEFVLQKREVVKHDNN